ncbi:MAG: class II aldolase/adducin family protein [Propionibacteriaceae bacterium]|jgi:L-fuculose-phosphate aldolase|nr:class II aldolase/adducin family protein [Propionibacteriaceae bacterium]
MTSRDDLIDALVEGARTLDAHRLVVAGAGNVSVVDGPTILITRSGVRFAEATRADITEVDLASGAHSGPRPSSETELHRGLYGRTDAGAIVHYHGIYSNAVAAVTDHLPAIHYYICALGGSVPVVDYHLFGSRDLADAVGREATGGRSAVLLRNHGAVVWADDLATAVERTLVLEWLCEVWWRSTLVGAPAILTASQLGQVRDQSARLKYGARAVADPSVPMAAPTPTSAQSSPAGQSSPLQRITPDYSPKE